MKIVAAVRKKHYFCNSYQEGEINIKNFMTMKRYMLMMALVAMTALTANAEGYDYLLVQKTDGSTLPFTASGLSITFENGNMILKESGNSTSLSLTDLSKMFFSATSEPSGIDMMTESTTLKTPAVYDLSGRRIDMGRLPKGIYIMNGKKIVVK